MCLLDSNKAQVDKKEAKQIQTLKTKSLEK